VSVDVRLLTADDDLEPELDLGHRAFGPFGADERERRLASAQASVAAGRQLAAFDGSAMVASARYFDMRQWWNGRSLPMAGVAGVKVAPEERGRGVGRALMTGLLEQIAADGYALSVLYPATSAVYRSVGWELAGGQYDVTVPARSLRSLQPPDPLAQAAEAPGAAGAAGAGPGAAGAGLGVAGGAGGGAVNGATATVRRAGPADAAEIIARSGELHAAARDCGPVTFDAATLAGLLDDPSMYCYLALDGFLAYRWNRTSDQMLAYCVHAGSAATARALWSILASHGTMVTGVRAFVNPVDSVNWLVREPDVTLSRREMWMLRLVDPPAAIAGRGFPEGVGLAVGLSLRDAQLSGNSGPWMLEISGGKGSLTRVETIPGSARSAGPLRLGARGLAAMYAGTPLASLRQAGLAAGGEPGADAALNEAFAGAPYMFDYF
jgi:predicted acetyltransferase